MSSRNIYLQLPRGVVRDRRIERREMLQAPQVNSALEMDAMQLAFGVTFTEVSPQFDGVPIESIVATVIRSETGEVVAIVQTDYGV